MTVLSLHESCPNTEFFPGPFFPVFELNTMIYGVNLLRTYPNKGKYGPEKTPYLGSFHAVSILRL